MFLFRFIFSFAILLVAGVAFAQGADAQLVGRSLSAKKVTEGGEDLAQLISAALQTNPLVKSRVSLADSARSGVSTARWQFFPTPSAMIQRANVSKTDPAYLGGQQVAKLGVDQPIWTGGKLLANLGYSENQLLVSIAELEEAKQQLAVRVVQAFSDWTAAHGKVIAYERGVATHRKLLELIRRRIEQGLSPESDYVFANGRLEQTMGDLDSATSQKEIARVRLTQLLGEPISNANLARKVRHKIAYSYTPDELLQMALEGNPLIVKFQAQVKAQDSLVDVAKSALSPTVGVRFERQYGDFAVPVGNVAQNRALITVSTVYGAGLSNFSQISGAVAKRDSAIADEETAKRNITDVILGDVSLLKKEEARVRSTKLAYEAARSTAESWERQFLAGKKQWQDLLNSTRELANNEAAFSEAKAGLTFASWSLAIASMGLAPTFSLASATTYEEKSK